MKKFLFLLAAVLPLISSGSTKTPIIFTSKDGYVRALNHNARYEIWRAYVGTNNWYHCTESADLVFVGTDDKCLYALKKNSGRIAWRFDTGDYISSGPIVAGGLVIFSSDDGYLYAVKISSGRMRWSFFIGNVTAAPALTSTGEIFIGGESGTLYGLDLKDGSVEWAYKKSTMPITKIVSNGKERCLCKHSNILPSSSGFSADFWTAVIKGFHITAFPLPK